MSFSLYKIEYKFVSGINKDLTELLSTYINEHGIIYLDQNTKEELLEQMRKEGFSKEDIEIIKKLEADFDYIFL